MTIEACVVPMDLLHKICALAAKTDASDEAREEFNSYVQWLDNTNLLIVPAGTYRASIVFADGSASQIDFRTRRHLSETKLEGIIRARYYTRIIFLELENIREPVEIELEPELTPEAIDEMIEDAHQLRNDTPSANRIRTINRLISVIRQLQPEEDL